MLMVDASTLDTTTVIDMVRPNLIDEKDFLFWEAVHEYVKESDIEIATSRAFYEIEDLLKARQGYAGGGFKYMFGFKSKTDRLTFFVEMDKLQQLFYGSRFSARIDRNTFQSLEEAQSA